MSTVLRSNVLGSSENQEFNSYPNFSEINNLAKKIKDYVVSIFTCPLFMCPKKNHEPVARIRPRVVDEDILPEVKNLNIEYVKNQTVILPDPQPRELSVRKVFMISAATTTGNAVATETVHNLLPAIVKWGAHSAVVTTAVACAPSFCVGAVGGWVYWKCSEKILKMFKSQ